MNLLKILIGFLATIGFWLAAWGFGILSLTGLMIWGWDYLNRPTGLPLMTSTEEAVATSLARIGEPALTRLVRERRHVCTITGALGVGWEVYCPDIQRTRTSPGEMCRSVDWKIDRWRRPSDGSAGNRYASIEDRCRTSDESRPVEPAPTEPAYR